jgi:PAS domain-containing protein
MGSEQVRASAAQGVSSKHYLAMIENAIDVGCWTWDPTSNAIQWSDGLHRLMRTDPKSYHPTVENVLAMVHPDDRWVLWQNVAQGVPVRGATTKVTRADGSLSWQVPYIEILEGPDGRVERVIGVVHDITDRAVANASRLEFKRALENLALMLNAMIWLAKADGTLLFAVGWCEYTGLAVAETIGDSWLGCLHPDDRYAAAKQRRDAFNAKGAFNFVSRVRRFDGVYEPWRFRGEPVSIGGHTATDWIGLCERVAPHVSQEAAAIPQAQANVYEADADVLRSARYLLGLSVQNLAAASGVSTATIARFEARQDGAAKIKPANRRRLQATLEAAGIRFSREDDGAVVIRRVAPQSS